MRNGNHRRAVTQASCDPSKPSSAGYLTARPGAPYPAQYPSASGGPVESAGIRAGEIIGYRTWKIINGCLLGSAIIDLIWTYKVMPRASNADPMYGNFVHGYYAFKSMEQVKEEFDSEWARHYGSAYGTVLMWGEVIEHEYGWRSEYVEVRSIDEVVSGYPLYGKDLLPRLRAAYGV